MQWTKYHTNLPWRMAVAQASWNRRIVFFPVLSCYTDQHKRGGSLATGAQIASRGRRDMSSRVRDIVLSLALCHNVCHQIINIGEMLTRWSLQGYASEGRRRDSHVSGFITR